MPSARFFAAGTDIEEMLAFVFSQTNCKVFEAYSRFDSDLVEFADTASLLERVPEGTIQLMLWPRKAGCEPTVRRIELNASTGATFRYVVNGWGLVQLLFDRQNPLAFSVLSCNSATRARNWSPTYAEVMPDSAHWDMKETAKLFGQVHRFIRKTAVGKIRSAPILRGAASLRTAGVPLKPPWSWDMFEATR